jgi:EamA-like transporter family
VIVAGLAVLFDGARVNLAAWAGFGLSLAGITVVAGAGGGDASLAGDGLVLLSVLIGSAFTVIQARLLAGQDVIAVSAAQFLASAVVIAPIAVVTEGLPSPGDWSRSALLAAAALTTVGTVLPYTLFAYGQTGVPAQIAGAFLNLETLVAALLGATLFGEPKSLGQGVGALALLGGIFLSTWHGVEPATELELVPELVPQWDGMSELAQVPALPRPLSMIVKTSSVIGRRGLHDHEMCEFRRREGSSGRPFEAPPIMFQQLMTSLPSTACASGRGLHSVSSWPSASSARTSAASRLPPSARRRSSAISARSVANSTS